MKLGGKSYQIRFRLHNGFVWGGETQSSLNFRKDINYHIALLSAKAEILEWGALKGQM